MKKHPYLMAPRRGHIPRELERFRTDDHPPGYLRIGGEWVSPRAWERMFVRALAITARDGSPQAFELTVPLKTTPLSPSDAAVMNDAGE